MTDEERDEKEFQELMWIPILSLRWNEVARQEWLDVWLASRRTLREQTRNDPSIGKLEVEDWPESPDY